MESALEDADIMERVRSRDQRALECLYDKYSPAVYALLLRMLGRDDSDETLIDVFEQAWRKAHSWDDRRGTVVSWLLTMARTRALDRLRSLAARARLDSALAGESERVGAMAPDFLSGRVEAKELGKAVREALGTLPETQRLPLELAYFQGLTQQAIATHLAQPLGTVKTRIRLGLERLRTALGKREWLQ